MALDRLEIRRRAEKRKHIAVTLKGTPREVFRALRLGLDADTLIEIASKLMRELARRKGLKLRARKRKAGR